MKKRWLSWLLITAILLGTMLCMPVSASAASTAKLSASSKMIEIGKRFALKVSGTKAKVSYSSANKAVAAVTVKGVVTAKKVGKTTIYAKVGRQTLKCVVRVTYKRTYFTLRGQRFSLAIPPTWTYRYSKFRSLTNIEFYDKYVYQHYGSRGILFSVEAYTDAQLAKFSAEEACIAFGKLGKYNFVANLRTGLGYTGNKTADDRYLKSIELRPSIAATFLPAAKTAKQKAYNAYFQFLTTPMCAGCPFALAYITNDNIPELIVDLSYSNSYRGDYRDIVIYTYKGGLVQELCEAGMHQHAVRAGYYFKKNVAVSFEGNSVFGEIYFNVSKNKELLGWASGLHNGRRVFAYSNASHREISKATFNRALKKYTGGAKMRHYTFRKNTLANRKKYLHN